MSIFRRSYDPPPVPQSPLPIVIAGNGGDMAPTCIDGSPIVRTAIARRCLNFSLRSVTFYTSRLNSLHNICPCSDCDFEDMTLSLFKKVNDSWVAATDTDATKTVLDWEAKYNFEIIGGKLDIPRDLSEGSTDEWYVAVIGVPDYPSYMGGSIKYLTEVNLEAVTDPHVTMDGRATSYMAYRYGGAPYTNRVRVVFKHPAGAQKRFQLHLEHFV